jgi:hypothetical protein
MTATLGESIESSGRELGEWIETAVDPGSRSGSDRDAEDRHGDR